MRKKGLLITARLKSERLKRKILLKIGGKSLLDILIDRAKTIDEISEIVLCSSFLHEDSELFYVAKKNDILFFPGEPNDVIKRLHNAAEYFGIDAFLSITADNPFFSPLLSNYIIKKSEEERLQFSKAVDIPLGICPYYLDTDSLGVALELKNMEDTEIWGPFVFYKKLFRVCDFSFPELKVLNNFRFTCDYYEDFVFLNKIYNHFSTFYFDIFEIQESFRLIHQLHKLNDKITQRTLSERKLNEINSFLDKNFELGKTLMQSQGISFNPGLITKEVYNENVFV